MKRCVLVIGASGDVGQGIAAELLRAGHRVIGAGRDAGKLAVIRSALAADGELETLAGSVADEAAAALLRDQAVALAGRLDAVIVTVNSTPRQAPLRAFSSAQLLETISANVLPHFVAANAFLPVLGESATYLAIGGGMADVALAGYGPPALCQAALRALLRGYAVEAASMPGSPRIHELMLHSMIAAASNRASAAPHWLTAEDVGRHVALILGNPAAFPEPVLSLKSRKQAGQLPLAPPEPCLALDVRPKSVQSMKN